MFAQPALVKEMKNLRSFALRLTRNGDDADDLLQSTLLRAIEKRHLFQREGNLFSWLSKIMYNIFVSDYCRKKKFETQYDPESYIQYESIDASQDMIMEMAEVNEAMKEIPEDHSSILNMVAVKGMRYAEVSEALQIPIGTVRSRLSRARENLQSALETPRMRFPVAGRSASYNGNVRIAA